MLLDPDSCFRALRTRDPRFDGRVFVSVRSTGIYCRPVCPARIARREQLQFHPSAAAAEAAGFRPCLRCRPELAPGLASIDAQARLVQRAVARIEGGALEQRSLAQLAAELGVTDRHLRRSFALSLGVSPIDFAQTHRLLLAKRLLTDTRLSVTEIAFASGFRSLRRFNSLFRSRYRLAPLALRRTGSVPLRTRTRRGLRAAARARGGRAALQGHRLRLGYRPPYAWDFVLAFLTARALPGVEHAARGSWCRSLRIAGRTGESSGWLQVRLGRGDTLDCTLSESLGRVLPQALAAVRSLFDLAADPGTIDTHLGELADLGGVRVPGAVDGFELAVRAVLGQQVSVAAARTMAGRLVQRFGEPLTTPWSEVSRLFPTPARLAQLELEELASLGIVRTRAATLLALARACERGELELRPDADLERQLTRLRALPGIGEWTAQYIAMRALAWPDAFPAEDLVLRRALGARSATAARESVAGFSPWRAYAAMHLWRRS